MSVRAKFKVANKEHGIGGDADTGTVTLYPVVGGEGNEEKDRFYKYTPGGQILLSTVNAAAFQQFEIGREYYVDFTLVEQAAASTAPPAIAG